MPRAGAPGRVDAAGGRTRRSRCRGRPRAGAPGRVDAAGADGGRSCIRRDMVRYPIAFATDSTPWAPTVPLPSTPTHPPWAPTASMPPTPPDPTPRPGRTPVSEPSGPNRATRGRPRACRVDAWTPATGIPGHVTGMLGQAAGMVGRPRARRGTACGTRLDGSARLAGQGRAGRLPSSRCATSRRASRARR